MVFFRNVQLRWTPYQTTTSNVMIALERPGASGDQGVYADRIELQGIRARFPVPDFSGAYKYTAEVGPRRAAPGMLRRINWDDTSGRRVRPVGARHRLGHEPQLEHQAGQERRVRLQFTCSAKASRTT